MLNVSKLLLIITLSIFFQQTAESGLYQEVTASDDVTGDDIFDVKGADMNSALDKFDAYELDKLFEYFKNRGPRAYDEEYY